MYQLILSCHVIVAIALVGLVLLQQGKGATMGAAFGSGASQTVFGSRGSGSFLLKLTALLALIFFTTSIVLNRMTVEQVKEQHHAALSMPVPMSTASVKLPVGQHHKNRKVKEKR